MLSLMAMVRARKFCNRDILCPPLRSPPFLSHPIFPIGDAATCGDRDANAASFVSSGAPARDGSHRNEKLLQDPVRLRQISERIPAGRWGEPRDFAGPVVFLASAASNYVCGELLVVDGVSSLSCSSFFALRSFACLLPPSIPISRPSGLGLLPVSYLPLLVRAHAHAHPHTRAISALGRGPRGGAGHATRCGPGVGFVRGVDVLLCTCCFV